ncbi:MAG: alkaline phosphatase family protein, partial [Acidobacteria bacterium]|nr:alkaline phosphatase family protein [Acidobacteriota bacterium]
ALLATGAYPERTGIIAERWYDRRSGRVVTAVEDPVHRVSPRTLFGATLGDELQFATGGRSRVVSISLRDQTAVLLGGRRPAGCYWLDAAGRFATSPYYAAGAPGWVAAFEKTHPPERFLARAWKALDAKDGTPPLQVINGKEAYLASPLAVDEEFEFARDAAAGEQLGQRSSSDLLILSLSSFYLLGLEVGADSPLMRDLVLRLDRELEGFLAWLDARLGADHVWVAFTATQGIGESPETLRARGLPAGRVSGEDIAAAVNNRLSAAFGRNRYVEKYVFPSLYLRRAAVERLAEAARLAGEAALGVAGVAGYFVPNGPSSFLAPESAQPLARSWAPERAGDVLLAYQPYYTELFAGGRGVSPGSFYNYDTRVPLIFYGAAFRAQAFDGPASGADLAPTLAAALEIPPPSSSTGRVLAEALKDK